MSNFGTVARHIGLSARLFLSHGAMLSAIWAAGYLATQLVMRAAVELGLISRLAGLVMLSAAVLVQLMVFVASFAVLRPRPAQAGALSDIPQAEDRASDSVPAMMIAALIPFYAYYAGWGLLGDTLRSYSQQFMTAQMARADFSDPSPLGAALDIGQTGWVVLAVALIWALRRFAKTRQKHSRAAVWPLAVVACEATWAALGLYVISGWKDGIADWLATLPSPEDFFSGLIPGAEAAVSGAAQRPVDWPPEFALWPFLVRLFWYALLPLIWFNLGAIVNEYDPHLIRAETRRVGDRAIAHWKGLSRPVRDFIGHGWMGLIKRWHAVVNGVLLASSAGLALTVSVLVLWRLVDWLGNWAWIGLAQAIGPHDMADWQLLQLPLNLCFGLPGESPGGLLVSPLQFCILAAGLRLAESALATRALTEGAAPD